MWHIATGNIMATANMDVIICRVLSYYDTIAYGYGMVILRAAIYSLLADTIIKINHIAGGQAA